MDSYRIPTKSGASEYVDKRSRFLGLVRPVGSEDEARTIIAACKKQYHDARHNCWCYLLRDGTERYSDDGEPQGTAGIPMLEVFRRAGVTNVVCVVTRYFGGVLLGTGGLLRAYTAAAADALADAGISEVRRWLACEVSTPYALYEPVRAAVAALGGVVQETQYAAAVTVCALLPEEAGEAFAAQVRDLTAAAPCAPSARRSAPSPSPARACERVCTVPVRAARRRIGVYKHRKALPNREGFRAAAHLLPCPLRRE
mgnify:CR=1 FL=1